MSLAFPNLFSFCFLIGLYLVFLLTTVEKLTLVIVELLLYMSSFRRGLLVLSAVLLTICALVEGRAAARGQAAAAVTYSRACEAAAAAA